MYDPNNPNDVRNPLHPANTGELSGGGGGGMINLGPLIASGLIILAAIVVLVLVFFAKWAAIAIFIDWWFIWSGLPLVGLIVARQKGYNSGVVKIAIGAFSLVTLVMILAGVTGQSVVWSGTGCTRGNELWIPPYEISFPPMRLQWNCKSWSKSFTENVDDVYEEVGCSDCDTNSTDQQQSKVAADRENTDASVPTVNSVDIVTNPVDVPIPTNSPLVLPAPRPTIATGIDGANETPSPSPAPKDSKVAGSVPTPTATTILKSPTPVPAPVPYSPTEVDYWIVYDGYKEVEWITAEKRMSEYMNVFIGASAIGQLKSTKDSFISFVQSNDSTSLAIYSAELIPVLAARKYDTSTDSMAHTIANPTSQEDANIGCWIAYSANRLRYAGAFSVMLPSMPDRCHRLYIDYQVKTSKGDVESSWIEWIANILR